MADTNLARVAREDAMENEENLTHLPVDSNGVELSAHEIREIMISGDKKRMKENRDIFYVTGITAWTVRTPHWNIALATDPQGNRFLSDEVLDRALPKWRLILNGEKVRTPTYQTSGQALREWLAAERQKARRLGKPWPQVQPSPPVAVSASSPKTAGPDRTSSAVSPRIPSGGHAHTSSFGETEKTRFFREVLAEVKQTRRKAEELIRRMTENSPQTDLVMSEQVHGPACQFQPAQPFYMPRYPTEVQQLPPTSDADYLTAPEPMQQTQGHPFQDLPPAPADADWEQWMVFPEDN